MSDIEDLVDRITMHMGWIVGDDRPSSNGWDLFAEAAQALREQADMIDKLRKRAVEAWHQTAEGTEMPIHEYAYMTLDEYTAWA